ALSMGAIIKCLKGDEDPLEGTLLKKLNTHDNIIVPWEDSPNGIDEKSNTAFPTDDSINKLRIIIRLEESVENVRSELEKSKMAFYTKYRASRYSWDHLNGYYRYLDKFDNMIIVGKYSG
ncbi:MAG: hypothetical protein DRH93_20005, partial [Deltaproteobacteria bacterium]